MKKRKAFSLIELVMLMAIVGVIAAIGASVAIFAIRQAVYTPNAMNTAMLAEAAIDKIVDGDNLARGLRFSKQITAAGANSVTFVDQDDKTVTIALDTGTHKLTRTINAAADTNFLYYQAASNIAIATGRNGALFIYYDVNENTTSAAANIRRVEVNLAVATGSGSTADWQGKSEQSSSVRVPKFQ